MKNIVILGNGLAALTLSYHLSNIDIEIDVISPYDDFNIATPGIRFLHEHQSTAFSDLLVQMGVCPVIKKLDGGVLYFDSIKCRRYNWAYLLKHPDLRSFLSKGYATYTGRIWTRSIMNNLVNMTEIPSYIATPTYQDLVHFMYDHIGDNITLHKDTILKVDADRSLVKTEQNSHKYDCLVNTIPYWAFIELLSINRNEELLQKEEVEYSEPRYATQNTLDKTYNTMSMMYWVRLKCASYETPIKRVSIMGNTQIVEYFGRPDIPDITQLPPNIVTPTTDKWYHTVKVLKDRRIYLLGRFASLKSKLMLTDIIDNAASIVQYIKDH